MKAKSLLFLSFIMFHLIIYEDFFKIKIYNFYGRIYKTIKIKYISLISIYLLFNNHLKQFDY